MSPTRRTPEHAQPAPRDTQDHRLCCADGLGRGVFVGSQPHPVLCSLQGWKAQGELVYHSAPGSGDELRLAPCPPRAGPGLSHGGQMTTEVKWVPSCSPRGAAGHPTLPPRVGHPTKGARHSQAKEKVERFKVQAPLRSPPLSRGQQGRSPWLSTQPGPLP